MDDGHRTNLYRQIDFEKTFFDIYGLDHISSNRIILDCLFLTSLTFIKLLFIRNNGCCQIVFVFFLREPSFVLQSTANISKKSLNRHWPNYRGIAHSTA